MHIIYKLGSLPTEIGNLNKLIVLHVCCSRYSGEICVTIILNSFVVIIIAIILYTCKIYIIYNMLNYDI